MYRFCGEPATIPPRSSPASLTGGRSGRLEERQLPQAEHAPAPLPAELRAPLDAQPGRTIATTSNNQHHRRAFVFNTAFSSVKKDLFPNRQHPSAL